MEVRSITYVAVRLVVVSAYGDVAVVQHGHNPLKVALVDDAPIVRAGLWTLCVEILPEESM